MPIAVGFVASVIVAHAIVPTCRKALRSLLDRWSGLTLFVDDPKIPMDNNASERTVCGPAMGRKDYFGSGAL